MHFPRNGKLALILFTAALASSAQTITFVPESPAASTPVATTTPVTIGNVTTSPSGLSLVLNSYEPLAWFPSGNVCTTKEYSMLVPTTPAPISICIDSTMPAGYHVLFLAAANTSVTATAGLPVNVGKSNISADQPTISLTGASASQTLNISTSGTAKIKSVVASTAQPGVGNWLSVGSNCTSGQATCQTMVSASSAALSAPLPGFTYIGKITATASDGTIAETLVQYQYEPSGTTPVVITTPGTLNGLVGENFSVTLSATGGKAPYTWTATGLPSGLSITSAGVISGTVSSAGTSQVTVKATDSVNQTQSEQIALVFATRNTAIPTQLFPHIAADTGGWQTDITLLNTGATSVSFTLRFHTDTGAPMSIEGQGSVGQITGMIPPHGSVFYRTDVTTNSDGWAEVDSAVPLSGVATFRLHASDGNYYEASDYLTSPGSGFIVPFDSTAFAGTSGYATGLAVVNADPTQKAQLTCTVYDSGGDTIASNLQLPALNASGHTAVLLEQLSSFATATANIRGQLVCTANTQVAAIALRALNHSVSSVPVIMAQ